MSTAFSDLRVWQRAMDLALEVYQTTRSFPRDETYGLTSQMPEQQFRYLATLRKGEADSLTRNSFNISSMREAHCWNWKRKSSWRTGSVTSAPTEPRT